MTETLLAGLIGHPVAHSRSPALQQAAFDALGIAARYELWDTPAEALAARVAALRAPGYLGVNVTIPHKAAVIPLLDAIDPMAARLAAVNTIARERAAESGSARLVGYNTDVTGLRRALAEQGAWTAGRRMLVLGAGGAALAALGVANLEGAAVWMAARRVEAARAALDAFQRRAHADDPIPRNRDDGPEQAIAIDDTERLSAALAECAVLINATPVGTRDPDASPIPAALLRRLPAGAFVFDMVYNPRKTALVRAAHALGLRASGGLPMLLYQGADAFRLWTGHEPPLDVMRNAVGIAT
jgi:shikimate dehydrogenase